MADKNSTLMDANMNYSGLVSKSDYAPTGNTCSERYDEWRETISVLFEVDIVDELADNHFDVRLRSYWLGAAIVVETTTCAQWFRRPASRIARDGLDHYIIQIFTSGGCFIEGTRRTEPGDILVIDAAQPYSVVTSNFSNVSFVIPRNSLAPLLENPDEVHGKVFCGNTAVTKILYNHLLAFSRNLSQLDTQSANALLLPTLHLMAATINPSPTENDEVRRTTRWAQQQRIKDWLRKQLSDYTLAPDKIAQYCRLSRSELYRVFKVEGGVMRFINRERLRIALQMLLKPRSCNLSIQEIADECGFRSHSQFCRSFRTQYGMSPRDFRKSPVKASYSQRSTSLGSQQYENWISRL